MRTKKTGQLFSRLIVTFGEEVDTRFLMRGVDIQLSGHAQIKIEQHLTNAIEESKAWLRARITAGPFQTEEEALAEGLRVETALLLFSVSRKFSLSLEMQNGKTVEVVEINPNICIEMRGYGRSVWPATPATFSEELRTHWLSAALTRSARARVSLRFYAAAQMETSPEARFVLYITATESISNQETYDASVIRALESSARSIVSELGKDHPLSASLANQIRGLKRESVSKSIQRALKPYLVDEQLKIIVSAYVHRSKLLHEGQSIPDIEALCNSVANILRHFYSKFFDLSLKTPIYP